jgi:glycosyltransferase involved in cell wall biosynthesis
MTYKMTVEGWRFLPHSFSIINQFQCLEILKRKEIELFHQDAPYFKNSWTCHENLFTSSDEIALKQIQSPNIDQKSDVTLRIDYPFRFDLSNSKRTYIFITSEQSYVANDALWLNCSLAEAHRNFDVSLITPSNWSKNGLINSGADVSRIAVVPHGVEPNIFRPVPVAERLLLRKQFGFEDNFLFLSIGSMSDNKRIDLIIKSFARVAEKYPSARLILKGLDNIFTSRNSLINIVKNFLTDAETTFVLERLTYLGNPLPFSEVAKLYQMADAYVSPYGAEGFNLPVLEAAACGLPIICTKGGATDDFTNSDFTLYIDSQLVVPSWNESAIWLNANLDHLIELMHFVIEKDAFRESARIKAYEYVHQNFTWRHAVDKLLNVIGLDN